MTKWNISFARGETRKFWKNTDSSDPDSCWNWTGKTYGDPPYGNYRIVLENGRKWTETGAHRIAWFIKNRRPIYKGQMICHKCTNSLCCNPNHLYLGNAYTNYMDSIVNGKNKLKNGKNLI